MSNFEIMGTEQPTIDEIAKFTGRMILRRPRDDDLLPGGSPIRSIVI